MYAFIRGLIVGVMFGAIGMGIWVKAYEPHCPTEDSCQMVRENGTSRIVEVTP